MSDKLNTKDAAMEKSTKKETKKKDVILFGDKVFASINLGRVGEEVFDIEGAAKFLGVSVPYVRRLMDRELIRHSKLGDSNTSLIRILKSACIEFLEQHEKTPGLDRAG